MRTISGEESDPHAPNTLWRYDSKWGLEWRGDNGIRVQIHWTTDLSVWVATPERVTLWYNLMRQTQ